MVIIISLVVSSCAHFPQTLLGAYIGSKSKFIIVNAKSQQPGSPAELNQRSEKAMHVFLAAAMYAALALLSTIC